MRGLDENGNNVDTAQVSGSIYVPTISYSTSVSINRFKEKYPSLTITYDEVGPAVTHQLIMRTLSGDYENNRVTTIGDHAFNGCKGLTGVSFPVAETVGRGSFADCGDKLVKVDLPNAVQLDESFPYSGNKISTLCLPKATAVSVRLSWFGRVELPSFTEFKDAAFSETPNLAVIILPKVTLIPAYCGLGSRATHKNVVLANPSVVTLTGTSGVFNYSTTVYVPQALISEYQSATNWAVKYAEGKVAFAAIEGSEYE
jgi:hypothetical protein